MSLSDYRIRDLRRKLQNLRRLAARREGVNVRDVEVLAELVRVHNGGAQVTLITRRNDGTGLVTEWGESL